MPRVIVLDTLSQEGLDLLAAAKEKGVEFEVLMTLYHKPPEEHAPSNGC